MTLADQKIVVIVGAGSVGSTFAYALAQSGLAEEIIIIDKNEELARGQVLDLSHGQPYFPAVSIREGNSSDYRKAQLIVITAGTAQRPGETRLQLLQRNSAIVQGIVYDIVNQKSNSVILVVSNPVDVMTYVAIQSARREKGQVFGSGTVLDSARLRYILSEHCIVDVHNVHGYILGEHGDSEFAAWSMTHIAGMPIDEFCPLCRQCPDWTAERVKIEQKVRNSAYHIIDYKGATNFAIGLSLVRITGAILRGERSVLTVSTILDGEYGLQDVCLSLPCIVSAGGVEKVIEGVLPSNEIAALRASAAVISTAIAELEIEF